MLCQFQVYGTVIQVYLYLCIFFPDSFPLQVIKKYWIQFLVLHSRSLLTVYFIYSSVYTLIPNPQFHLPCFCLTYLGDQEGVIITANSFHNCPFMFSKQFYIQYVIRFTLPLSHGCSHNGQSNDCIFWEKETRVQRMSKWMASV